MERKFIREGMGGRRIGDRTLDQKSLSSGKLGKRRGDNVQMAKSKKGNIGRREKVFEKKRGHQSVGGSSGEREKR